MRRSLQHEWTAYSATSFASTVFIHPSLPLWSVRFVKVPQESPPRVSKLGIGRMFFRPPPERSAEEHPAGGSLPNTSCQRPRLHPWSPPRDEVSHVSFPVYVQLKSPLRGHTRRVVMGRKMLYPASVTFPTRTCASDFICIVRSGSEGAEPTHTISSCPDPEYAGGRLQSQPTWMQRHATPRTRGPNGFDLAIVARTKWTSDTAKLLESP